MEFSELIKKRNSVRQYKEQDVPDALINEIIILAKTGPSAGGIKAYEVYITRERITNQNNAPVFLVVCADPQKSAKKYGSRGTTLYSIQDATIFAYYVQLIAIDKGLSSVWIGSFNENRLKRSLKIPDHFQPIAIISLGYQL
jgi:nitroreductase